MFFRYLVLSPSSEMRQAFLGGLFGTFELAPRGQGEKARMVTAEGDELEIVGAGEASKLRASGKALIKRGIQIDGVLMLLPSGDEDSWNDAQSLIEWLQQGERPVPFKTWVVDALTEMDKPTTKRIFTGLMDEHQRSMKSP